MSVQFGILNLDGKPVRAELFEKVLPMIAPYGPDGTNSYIKNNLGVLFCAFHSTPEAVRETQPHMSLRSGATLTWDGRLRSEEHTSELQSPCNLVCRLLLEKKKNNDTHIATSNLCSFILHLPCPPHSPTATMLPMSSKTDRKRRSETASRRPTVIERYRHAL